MPVITVSAILLDRGRVLLARRHGEEAWTLPGGLLAETDETVEDAIARALAESFAIDVTECEFLDTMYERGIGGVVVHNVFAARAVAGPLPADGDQGEHELRWVSTEELAEMGLPLWLGEALTALLTGEHPPEPELDLSGITAPSGSVALPAWLFAPEPAPVIIVNGPPGVGKSTVARALCARFARAAHVDVDLLRWQMVPSGYVPPEVASGHRDLDAAGPTAREARRQLDLAALNAATVARNFALAGFTAVIDHVLEYRAELDLMLACLEGLDVAFVTLMPDCDTAQTRDSGRGGVQQVGQRALALYDILGANGETRGLRLDTSAMTVEETVETLLRRLDEARVMRPGEVVR